MSFPLSFLFFAATAIGAMVDAAYETIPDHDCLRSMTGMMESMRDLAEAHPDLVSIVKIGESYLKNNDGPAAFEYDVPTGGHDIFALNVTASNGPASSGSKGRFLITSGVHAREYAPPELLARFVEELANGYGVDAEITTILQRTEIHAILYVNPDGRWMAERYPELLWRKNLNFGGGNDGCDDIVGNPGVDINRNFNFKWGDLAGASNDPCANDYHGPSAESEPETRALVEYAKRLFPEGQRKNDPEGEMDVPFGEDITGIYLDIHASGGYVYYPWGHADSKSPDDEALQALGRKINSINEYKLWAGSQPDFLYPASGDTSDYMYAALGVASLGLEIGDDFYQECAAFEDEIVPINMPALMYAAKIARTPFRDGKGPDILDFEVVGDLVSARASDSEMVNAIGGGFPDFSTGNQLLAEVRLYLDVHPDDYNQGDGTSSWLMQRTTTSRRIEEMEDCYSIEKKKACIRAAGGGVCEWDRNEMKCGPSNSAQEAGANVFSTVEDGNLVFPSTAEANNDVQFDSGDETVQLEIDLSILGAGRRTLYVQATDSDGYKGPVSSLFISGSQRRASALSLRGTR